MNTMKVDFGRVAEYPPHKEEVVFNSPYSKTTITFELHFDRGDGSGCCFPCDSSGLVLLNDLQPCAKDNYYDAVSHPEKWETIEILPFSRTTNFCRCGSGLESWWEVDGYGIPLCKVCNRCYGENMSHYRSDIHERYQAEEPIDDE